MMYLPLIFFGLAALGGSTIVYMKYSGKGIPMPLAIGHGILAATGLVTLVIIVIRDTGNMVLNVSLILFLFIALGGFTLFSFHVRKKPMPEFLIPVHGFGAVISYVVLVLSVIK